MYKTADPLLYQQLKQYARENRKNMTLAERVLWDQIRDQRLGVKFLRQHIVGDYIADFACTAPGLIIEVDGGYHFRSLQQQDDAVRQEWLEKHGFRVIRFTNEEVEFDTPNVLSRIKASLFELSEQPNSANSST